MRLWSLAPRYLDAAGLVAVWREGLLARAVLAGATNGYKHHPQLARFRAARRPVAAIDTYLAAICDEADRRGYRFDRSKLGRARTRTQLPVTRGQLAFEWQHLAAKVGKRRPAWMPELGTGRRLRPHPQFRVVAGGVEAWERV
ncbi:MAG TPA: pyrimidine dimer DNA glycosylase/endonuclease V [Gemmatimonadaceae bacterium]|nr:pyrimidine dimer DNA glycosylase/endonuclease V [Gemmatimonadaceae bacterium]